MNRDDIPDIAVGGVGPGTAFFSLFIVRRTPPSVSKLQAGGGWSPGFAVGGTYQSGWGLICPGDSTLISWGAAETAEGNGPYSVLVRTFRLEGSRLIREHPHVFFVPQGDRSALPENGGVGFGANTGLCGARIRFPVFYT